MGALMVGMLMIGVIVGGVWFVKSLWDEKQK